MKFFNIIRLFTAQVCSFCNHEDNDLETLNLLTKIPTKTMLTNLDKTNIENQICKSNFFVIYHHSVLCDVSQLKLVVIFTAEETLVKHRSFHDLKSITIKFVLM